MIISKKYLKREAIYDILGNLPILFYSFNVEFPSNEEQLEMISQDIVYKICWLCKFLRILHAQQVTQTLRRLIDHLSSIFYLQTYLFHNLLNWMLAAFKLIVGIHYFACGWVVISKMKEEAG